MQVQGNESTDEGVVTLRGLCQRGQRYISVFSNRRTVSSVSGLAYVQESYYDSQTMQPKGCFE